MAVPFRVVGHPDANKPVYTVVPVDVSQAPKNIHRMELRPCGPGESANLGLEELAEPVTEEAQEHSEGEAVVVMQRPPRTLPASGHHSLDNGLDVGESESSDTDASAVSESERTEEKSPIPLMQPWQSRGQQAGRHTNPFRLPRSAVQRPGVEDEGGLGSIAHTNCYCLIALKEILIIFLRFDYRIGLLLCGVICVLGLIIGTMVTVMWVWLQRV